MRDFKGKSKTRYNIFIGKETKNRIQKICTKAQIADDKIPCYQPDSFPEGFIGALQKENRIDKTPGWKVFRKTQYRWKTHNDHVF